MGKITVKNIMEERKSTTAGLRGYYREGALGTVISRIPTDGVLFGARVRTPPKLLYAPPKAITFNFVIYLLQSLCLVSE